MFEVIYLEMKKIDESSVQIGYLEKKKKKNNTVPTVQYMSFHFSFCDALI